jgi:transmembrane sensor
MRHSIPSRLLSTRVRVVVARALRLYFAPLRVNPVYEGAARRSRHRVIRISLLLVAILGAAFGGVKLLLPPPFGESIVTEAQGAVMRLADGSTVAAGPNTRMNVRYGRQYRRIYLKAGQGTFTVAHAPSRPFDVITAVGEARAVGTEFSAIYSPPHDAEFSVQEGKIKVRKTQHDAAVNEPGGGYSLVVAGQTASISDGKLEIAPRGVHWQGAAMEVQGVTIAALADYLNRRESVKIVIDDPSVAAIVIRAMTLTHDVPRGFVERMADSPNIIATYEGDVVHLKSREGPCPSWFICADAQ